MPIPAAATPPPTVGVRSAVVLAHVGIGCATGTGGAGVAWVGV